MTNATSPSNPNNRASPQLAHLALFALRARAFFILFLLLILFTILTPDFMTVNNLSILAKHISINALLAVGMTFVILADGIDLSVGSIAGLGGIVAGMLITQGITLGGTVHYPPIPLVILIAVAVCIMIGVLNGFLVTKMRSLSSSQRSGPRISRVVCIRVYVGDGNFTNDPLDTFGTKAVVHVPCEFPC